MITVLLVDDHELVRTGIKSLLDSIEDIAVIAVCESGEKALEAVKTISPDVILLDVKMPGMGGVEACRQILQQVPEAKIIALSILNDGSVPQQILKLGALGFIYKGSAVDEMVKAIRTVASGRRYLCSEISNALAFQGLEEGQASPFSKLSRREYEVVNLILEGKSIKEMSGLLVLSDKTINTYRYRLYEKLGVKNDVELTRLALKFDQI